MPGDEQDFLIRVTVAGRDLLSNVFRAINKEADKATPALGRMEKQIDGLNRSISNLESNSETRLRKFGRAMEDASKKLQNELDKIEKKQESVRKKLVLFDEDLNKSYKEHASTMSALRAEYEKTGKSYETSREKMSAAEKKFQDDLDAASRRAERRTEKEILQMDKIKAAENDLEIVRERNRRAQRSSAPTLEQENAELKAINNLEAARIRLSEIEDEEANKTQERLRNLDKRRIALIQEKAALDELERKHTQAYANMKNAEEDFNTSSIRSLERRKEIQRELTDLDVETARVREDSLSRARRAVDDLSIALGNNERNSRSLIGALRELHQRHREMEVDNDTVSKGIVGFSRDLERAVRNLARFGNIARVLLSPVANTIKEFGDNVQQFLRADPGAGFFRQFLAGLAAMSSAAGNAVNNLVIMGGLLSTLSTAVISLAGALGALASSAIVAGAALGGALVAGIGQAIPAVALLLGVVNQVKGVLDVFKQEQAEQLKGGQAAQTAGRQRETAARQIRNAEESLASARRGVVDAQRRVLDAENNLTKARADARQELQDLIQAERDAKLAAEQSSLSMLSAQQRLQELVRSGGSAIEIRQAQLEIQQQREQQRKEEAESRQRRSRIAQLSAPGGIATSEGVVAAQEQLKQAYRGVADAQRQVAKAQESLADAYKDAAAGADKLTASQNKLQEMTKRLSPAQRDLLAEIRRLFDPVNGLVAKTINPISDIVVRALTRALRRGEALLKDTRLVDAFKTLARSVGGAIDIISQAFTSPEFRRLFEQLTRDAADNMPIIARAIVDIAKAFLQIANAAAPALHILLTDFTKWLGDLTKSTSDREQLRQFFIDGARQAEAWFRLAGSVVRLIWAISSSGAKTGVSIVKDITNQFNAWARWINEHPRRMQQFWQETKEGARQLWTVIKSVAQILMDAFDPNVLRAFTNFITQVVIPTIHTFYALVRPLIDAITFIFNLPGVNAAARWTIAFGGIGLIVGGISAKIFKLIEGIGNLAKFSGGAALFNFLRTLVNRWRGVEVAAEEAAAAETTAAGAGAGGGLGGAIRRLGGGSLLRGGITAGLIGAGAVAGAALGSWLGDIINKSRTARTEFERLRIAVKNLQGTDQRGNRVDFSDSFDKGATSAKKLADETKNLNQQLATNPQQLNKDRRAAEELEPKLRNLRDAYDRLETAVRNQTDAQRDAVRAHTALVDAQSRAAHANIDAARAIKDAQKATGEHITSVKEAMRWLDTHKNASLNDREAVINLIDALVEQERAQKQLSNRQDENNKKHKETKQQLKDVADAVENLADKYDKGAGPKGVKHFMDTIEELANKQRKLGNPQMADALDLIQKTTIAMGDIPPEKLITLLLKDPNNAYKTLNDIMKLHMQNPQIDFTLLLKLVAGWKKGQAWKDLGAAGLRGGGWIGGNPYADETPVLASGGEFFVTGPGQQQAVDAGMAHPMLWDWLAGNQAPHFSRGGYVQKMDSGGYVHPYPPYVGSGHRGRALSMREIAGYAKKAGWPQKTLATAIAVSKHESDGGYPVVWNTTGNSPPSIDAGLWQINSYWEQPWWKRGIEWLFNPLNNAKAAYAISRGGTTFSPWVSYKTGAYQQYLGEANRAAGNPASVSDSGSGGTRTVNFTTRSMSDRPLPSRFSAFSSGFLGGLAGGGSGILGSVLGSVGLVKQRETRNVPVPGRPDSTTPRARGKYRAILASGADRPGVKTRPEVIRFVDDLADLYGGNLTITTGSNHNQFVAGTNNTRQSAHWTGWAADLGNHYGADLTRLGRLSLYLAGMSKSSAFKQTGGAWHINGENLLFNTNIGGNHFNHLHAGLQSGAHWRQNFRRGGWFGAPLRRFQTGGLVPTARRQATRAGQGGDSDAAYAAVARALKKLEDTLGQMAEAGVERIRAFLVRRINQLKKKDDSPETERSIKRLQAALRLVDERVGEILGGKVGRALEAGDVGKGIGVALSVLADAIGGIQKGAKNLKDRVTRTMNLIEQTFAAIDAAVQKRIQRRDTASQAAQAGVSFGPGGKVTVGEKMSDVEAAENSLETLKADYADLVSERGFIQKTLDRLKKKLKRLKPGSPEWQLVKAEITRFEDAADANTQALLENIESQRQAEEAIEAARQEHEQKSLAHRAALRAQKLWAATHKFVDGVWKKVDDPIAVAQATLENLHDEAVTLTTERVELQAKKNELEKKRQAAIDKYGPDSPQAKAYDAKIDEYNELLDENAQKTMDNIDAQIEAQQAISEALDNAATKFISAIENTQSMVSSFISVVGTAMQVMGASAGAAADWVRQATIAMARNTINALLNLARRLGIQIPSDVLALLGKAGFSTSGLKSGPALAPGTLPFQQGGVVQKRDGGQVVLVGEAGFDEYILTTDPRYRKRNLRMASDYLRRVGMAFATGGVITDDFPAMTTSTTGTTSTTTTTMVSRVMSPAPGETGSTPTSGSTSTGGTGTTGTTGTTTPMIWYVPATTWNSWSYDQKDGWLDVVAVFGAEAGKQWSRHEWAWDSAGKFWKAGTAGVTVTGVPGQSVAPGIGVAPRTGNPPLPPGQSGTYLTGTPEAGTGGSGSLADQIVSGIIQGLGTIFGALLEAVNPPEEPKDPVVTELERINNKYDRDLELIDKQIQIDELNHDTAQELIDLNKKTTFLQNKGVELQALLLTTQPGSDQWYQVQSAILDNTIAIKQNEETIKNLSGTSSQPQTWASRAWQWFRVAIFDGLGGLLPQFTPPGDPMSETLPTIAPPPEPTYSATAANTNTSTATNGNETFLQPVDYSNQKYEPLPTTVNSTINVTEQVEKADPVLLSNMTAWAIKNSAMGGNVRMS